MQVYNSGKSRTARACQTCRRRKVKCDGATACKGCLDASEPCVYLEPTQKLVFKRFEPGSRRKRQTLSSEHSSPPVALRQSSPLQTSPNSQPSPAQESPAQHVSGIEQESTANLPPITSIANPSPPLSIPFFRCFGPTGIAPGYRRFFVPIKDGSDQQDSPMQITATNSTVDSIGSIPPLFLNNEAGEGSEPPLFEPDDGVTPSSEILFPLLETFFEYYSCHFPFLSRDPFINSVNEKKVPAVLLNSMCAMAALFSTLPVFQGRPAYVKGEVFINKAKHLLVPLLNLPSHEVLESILMIAWMELATCHDVGLWMYTGMAVRMAEDIGMHKKSTIQPGETESNRERLLYWAINLLDHIICFAVGRPLTTRREHVDIDLPAERLFQKQPFELASPFPSLIRVIQYQGLVNEQIRNLPEQRLDLPPEVRQQLTEYGNCMVAHYTSMHSSLAFDVSNFQAHAVNGQGGTFLLLHLWFNSVMISVHRPGIRFGQENHRDTNFLCSESRQISLSLARTTSSMLSLAELVDIKSIIGSPFIDQAVEVAGLVYIAELRIPPSINPPHPPTMMNERLREIGHQTNYQACLRTLQLLTLYWRGLKWILNTMEQKYMGVEETDPGESSVDPYTSVALSDRKMITWLLKRIEGKRAAARSHDEQPDTTIGIAMAGTINSASQRTVTIIETGQQNTAPSELTNNLATNVTRCGDFENDFIWTSWVDDGELWDFGLEYLDQNGH